MITADGVSDIQKDTNMIDDFIEGMTITLESAPATGNEAILTVSRNTSTIVSKINSFVNAYNEAIDLSEGFAVRMVDAPDDTLDSTAGTLAARTDGIQNSIGGIGDQVERIERRNSAWETRTRAQFNALKLLLAEYQTTGNYLTQQLQGMQNLNNYISNR